MAAKKQLSRMQQRRGLMVDVSGVVLNSGEFALAADERRLFIGNRTTENAPADENIEIFTEYSTIPESNISKTLSNSSFTTLGATTTFLTYDGATEALIFTYKITQNSIIRSGTFRVVSDGTNVSYDDNYIEAGGITAVTLTATISAGDLVIQYNATGNTATFEYFVEEL